MAFQRGSIVESSTPTADLYDVIHQMLTDHSAWELADTLDANVSGDERLSVWRSLGTANMWGEDFYLRMYDPANDSRVYFWCSEDYDNTTTGSEELIRPVGWDSDSIDQTNWARDPNNVSVIHNLASTFITMQLIVNVTAFDYYITLTPNFIAGATSDNIGGYAGLYEHFLDPVPTGIDFMPLLVWDNSTNGLVSRDLFKDGSTSRAFRTNGALWGSQHTGISEIPHYGSRGLDGRFQMYRVAMRGHRTGTLYYTDGGGLYFGLYLGALRTNTHTDVSRGDQVDVDGVTYWNVTQGEQGLWYPEDTST